MSREIINEKNNSKNSSGISIKEYYLVRDIHNKIMANMDEYFEKDKYNLKQKLSEVGPYLTKELNCKEEELKDYFDFDNDNIDIFYEVFYYDNHPNLVSITKEYVEKGIFKELEEIKMLEAMENSYSSLFQINNINDIYIELEDIFTKEKIEIIDTTLTVLSNISKDIYLYSRIINYNNISFIACTPIIIKKEKEEIKNYINNYDKNKSSLSRCLELYQIEKKIIKKVDTNM